jgi:mono/diheme cytochrome c family protein
MRTSRWIALSVATLGISLFARAAHSQEMTVAEVGRGFFQQYCSGCHGLEGKADGAFAAYLKVPPPDLTTIAKRRGGTFPDTEIAEIIDGRRPLAAHGTRDMPIWGQRFGDVASDSPAPRAAARGQVILLVAYLRSIQQK